MVKTGDASKSKMSAKEREELLIKNFVGLQSVMTNLSIKFEALTNQMTNLLRVFEESARRIVKGGSGEADNDLLRKISEYG